ncbi:hypothetical protein HK104_010602, partial [Borealophlyctis nickersoniae]
MIFFRGGRYHGGWVAPNIYFLGFAGVINVGGLRICGLSGIYKARNYEDGFFERQPFDDEDMRSVYHVRKFNVYRLAQIQNPIDVMISHDWPRGIAFHGNTRKLIKHKPFLAGEINTNTLGSYPGEFLLKRLRPTMWFAAHLHVKFAAVYKHDANQEYKPDAVPVENPDEIGIVDDDDDDDIVEDDGSGVSRGVEEDARSEAVEAPASTSEPKPQEADRDVEMEGSTAGGTREEGVTEPPQEAVVEVNGAVPHTEEATRGFGEHEEEKPEDHGDVGPQEHGEGNPEEQDEEMAVPEGEEKPEDPVSESASHVEQDPGSESVPAQSEAGESVPERNGAPKQKPRVPLPCLPILKEHATQTKFLALDKCLINRDFLQVIDVPELTGEPTFSYDEEWLAIMRATWDFFSLRKEQIKLPGDATIRSKIAENLEWVKENISSKPDGLRIPDNFAITAPPHRLAEKLAVPRKELERPCMNPQTLDLCTLLGVPNNINTTGIAPGERIFEEPKAEERSSSVKLEETDKDAAGGMEAGDSQTAESTPKEDESHAGESREETRDGEGEEQGEGQPGDDGMDSDAVLEGEEAAFYAQLAESGEQESGEQLEGAEQE